MFRKSLLSLSVAAVLATTASTSVAEVDLGITGDVTGIELIGRYTGSAAFDESAAEIASYDATTQQLFVVNANIGQIDVISIADPSNPSFVTTLDPATDITSITLGAANSVDVANGIVAVAVEADDKQANGVVAFYGTDGTFLGSATAGALPDMLTFTADGSKVLVANEGEPSDDYTVDPEGSISIITLPADFATGSATVATADFTAFNAQKDTLIAAGVRIFGPESTVDEADDIATVSQDLEPEYIALDANSNVAYVALQENNAIALLNLDTNTIDAIYPLGYKDHSVTGNALDASDRDSALVADDPAVNITTHANLFGMFQPDAIASVNMGGNTYLISANEGDARDYDGYLEESRLKDLGDDCFGATPATSIDSALSATIDDDDQLGRLKITCATGDNDADGDLDNVYVYGARSFTIWNPASFDTSGTMTTPNTAMVYDSGDDMEQITAAAFPDYFNAGNDDNELDSRSDSKGPEPEALAIGAAGSNYYAFIGLERIGGVMIYNITDPTAPSFISYDNNRDFTANYDDLADGLAAPESAGDLGPEGLLLISASDSPNGEPLLVVANEVSGTTTIYEVEVNASSTGSGNGSSSDDDGGLGAWWWLSGLLAPALFLRRRRG